MARGCSWPRGRSSPPAATDRRRAACARTCAAPAGRAGGQRIDAVIAATREQAGRGADWIKVYADYRWGPEGTQQPTFSVEELRALVETAHSSGRPVAAHAATAEGMRRAVLAGVDTIEHGYAGTPEIFKLMAAHGVAYLPTLEAEAAYAEYFEHYVPGARAHGGDAAGCHGVPRRAQERCHHRLWQRRRGIRPRHQLPRAAVDGRRRHDAGAGTDGGHRDGCEDPAP